MQLAVADLPEFPPRHRIGIKQRGLILRPSSDGPLAWSWARWSLVPAATKELPPSAARLHRRAGVQYQLDAALVVPDASVHGRERLV